MIYLQKKKKWRHKCSLKLEILMFQIISHIVKLFLIVQTIINGERSIYTNTILSSSDISIAIFTAHISS